MSIYSPHIDVISTPGVSLKEKLAATPADTTIINLSHSWLEFVKADEWANAFSAIPAQTKVHKLILNGNRLLSHDSGNLTKMLRSIPPSVKTLELSMCNLHYSLREVLDGFKGIPASITTLDLSGNRLFEQKSTEEAAQILRTIPRTVTTLNLSGNDLFEQKSTEEVAQILRTIPRTVTTLDLSYNELLTNKTDADLAKIFSALSFKVKTLKLWEDNFVCSVELTLAHVFEKLLAAKKYELVYEVILQLEESPQKDLFHSDLLVSISDGDIDRTILLEKLINFSVDNKGDWIKFSNLDAKRIIHSIYAAATDLVYPIVSSKIDNEASSFLLSDDTAHALKCLVLTRYIEAKNLANVEKPEWYPREKENIFRFLNEENRRELISEHLQILLDNATPAFHEDIIGSKKWEPLWASLGFNVPQKNASALLMAHGAFSYSMPQVSQETDLSPSSSNSSTPNLDYT